MAIADVYDALICERPYKPAFTHEEAERIIEKDSGSFFDPDIVSIFMDVRDAFKAASKEFNPQIGGQ
jgi:putative two-component system response regulator